MCVCVSAQFLKSLNRFNFPFEKNANGRLTCTCSFCVLLKYFIVEKDKKGLFLAFLAILKCFTVTPIMHTWLPYCDHLCSTGD